MALGIAGERGYPQWDGKETMATYATRVGLAPTLPLELGGALC